jgi:hypothetical protein
MKPKLPFIQAWLDYLGGVSDQPPPGFRGRLAVVGVAFWWAFLAGVIALFCGQTSKFIYIDF